MVASARGPRGDQAIANGNVVQMDREAARLCALYATSAPGIQNNSGLSQSHIYIASL